MKNLFKSYTIYFMRYRLQSLLAILGILLSTISLVGLLYAIQLLLENLLIEAAITLITFFLIKEIANAIKEYYLYYIGLNTLQELRNQFITQLSYQDLNFFKHSNTYKVLSDFNIYSLLIYNTIIKTMPNFIQTILIITALILYMLYFSPKLTLYSLLFLPLILSPFLYLKYRKNSYSSFLKKSTKFVSLHLNKLFSTIKTIKLNTTEEEENKKFIQEHQKSINLLLQYIRRSTLNSLFLKIFASIIVGLAIYFITDQMELDQNRTEELLSFLISLSILSLFIISTFNLSIKLKDALIANETIKDLLEKKPNILSGEIKLQDKIKHLSIMNSSLKDDGKLVLNSISLGVDRGESITLIGDINAGNSYLINLLLRLCDPNEGEIIINEKYNLKELTLNSLHKKIAYIAQDFYLFNATIAQNIAYGEEFNETKVKKALKRANALEFIENLEHGINTILSDNGDNLSKGQRESIALARALYKEPDVLILDETTSSIVNNKSEEALIQKALEELKHEVITITVTHKLTTRLTSIERADAILVFKNGKIVCRGQHQDLIKECSEYQRLAKLLI